MTRNIDAAEIEHLIQQSRTAPRSRAHVLLHKDHDDPVQRLLIAGQPDSFIRPHRHTVQWEMLVGLSGALDVLLIDDGRMVTTRRHLSPDAPVVQIPPGQIHTAVFMKPDTVVLEVKPGPYRPNEFCSWSPEEMTADAKRMLAVLATATTGAPV